ncbi:hypothetical protein FRC07_004177, partial [Ceratobasidium sp. 392]
MMLSSSQLPPPVSPFRPNLDALKLDISDDEDELGMEGEMDKIYGTQEEWIPPPESPADTPPLTRGESYVEFPSDSESPPHNPSPRPRATTLAQSANGLPTPSTASALPPLNSNRQFTRAASQPTGILGGGSPTQRPDTVSKTGTKRPLLPVSNKLLPSRPALSEVTPLTTRKPLLSASAGKF